MKLVRICVICILLLSTALFAFPGSAQAAGLNTEWVSKSGDEVVLGGSYVLESEETLSGSLFVLGGAATTEPDSTITGDVVVFGGNLTIAGEVRGDMIVLGGSINLEETASIRQNVTVIGGSLNGDRERIAGDVIETDNTFNVRSWGGVRMPSFNWIISPIWAGISFMFTLFVMSALAIGVMLFWPKQAEQTARAITSQPVVTGGMGLLTFVALPFVTVALAITILLIPAIPLAALVLAVMILFGWAALGLEVGRRLEGALKVQWHPALTAGLGTFALTFVTMGFANVVPCIGGVAPLLVSAVALGAVLLTRFGTQPLTGNANPFERTSTPAPTQLPVEAAPAPVADLPSETTGPSDDAGVPPAGEIPR